MLNKELLHTKTSLIDAEDEKARLAAEQVQVKFILLGIQLLCCVLSKTESFDIYL